MIGAGSVGGADTTLIAGKGKAVPVVPTAWLASGDDAAASLPLPLPPLLARAPAGAPGGGPGIGPGDTTVMMVPTFSDAALCRADSRSIRA